MKRKVWLVLAVVPVLLAAYVVKKSLLPALVSGREAPQSNRESGTMTPAGSVPEIPMSAGAAPADLDPFAALDKQYEAQRTAETARFDEAEARVKARIQPALDASMAKYKRDLENLEQMSLSAEQKNHWHKQLGAQFEKTRLDIKRAIQPELEELAAKRQEALDKLEADRAEKRGRLEEIQTRAEKGQLDPMAAKRAQFEILGISLPDSALQPSPDRPVPADTEPAPPQNGPPRVTAVVATAEDRFCALVEDALVSEGDTVRGYRVRKIDAQHVEFEKDGRTWMQKAN